MSSATQQQVLLRRSSFLPEESLSSLLARLTILNFYDPPSILTALILKPDDQEAVKDSITCPVNTITFRRTAALTKIEPGILYAATAHSFAKILMPPEQNPHLIEIDHDVYLPAISQEVLRRHIRQESASQFCPACLAEAAYQRLIWLPKVVSACLRHRCLLRQSCPKCSKPISLYSIIAARCSECQMDLAIAETIPIDGDVVGLNVQNVIQSWLLDRANSTGLERSLPTVLPNILYRVLEGLCTVIALVETDWTYRHRLTDESASELHSIHLHPKSMTSYQSYYLYTTAFRVLVDWPNGLYEFLDAFLSRPIQYGTSGTMDKLGTLYSRWLTQYWHHEEFGFLRDAFRKYLLEIGGLRRSVIYSDMYRYDEEFAQQFEYITIKEAADLLNVTTNTVNLLIKSERLKTYIPMDQPQFKMLKRLEILGLCVLWSGSMGLDQTASYMGVSSEVVIDLVSVGMLAAECSPVDGFARWLFIKSAIEACMVRVDVQVHRNLEEVLRHQKVRMVDLTKATQMLAAVGLNAAGVLARVAEGDLPAYGLGNNRQKFGELIFLDRDVRKFAGTIKTEYGWLGCKEVTEHLGVKDSTVTRWIHASILTPVAVKSGVPYFTQEQIDKFTSNYINSDHAAKILGVTVLTVQQWVRSGLLDALCGPNIDGSHAYLFDKVALTRWREERLTFREARELLGVTRKRLHNWVARGWITPFEGVQGKQRWFSRDDIVRIQEKIREAEATKHRR